jgi:hypothetical protein
MRGLTTFGCIEAAVLPAAVGFLRHLYYRCAQGPERFLTAIVFRFEILEIGHQGTLVQFIEEIARGYECGWLLALTTIEGRASIYTSLLGGALVEKTMLNPTVLDSVATDNSFKINTPGSILSNPTLLDFLAVTLFNAALLHIAVLVSSYEFGVNAYRAVFLRGVRAVLIGAFCRSVFYYGVVGAAEVSYSCQDMVCDSPEGALCYFTAMVFSIEMCESGQQVIFSHGMAVYNVLLGVYYPRHNCVSINWWASASFDVDFPLRLWLPRSATAVLVIADRDIVLLGASMDVSFLNAFVHWTISFDIAAHRPSSRVVASLCPVCAQMRCP